MLNNGMPESCHAFIYPGLLLDFADEYVVVLE